MWRDACLADEFATRGVGCSRPPDLSAIMDVRLASGIYLTGGDMAVSWLTHGLHTRADYTAFAYA